MDEEKKIGRPTTFSQEIADKICLLISTSNSSLRKICELEGMPCVQTILNWKNTLPDFLAQYARAKEEQADFLADEMLEICDDGSNDTIATEKGDFENKEWTSRSKLRVDTRKWIASKLKPKKYSEKIDVTTNGENINAPIIIDWSEDKKQDESK